MKEVDEELVDILSTFESISKKLTLDKELEKYYQTIRNDIDMLENLKRSLNSWDKAYEINQNLKFPTWPRQKVESELKDEAKKIRDDGKKKLSKILDKILIYNSRQANEDIYDMYSILSKLKNLIFEFNEEFSKRKRNKNIVDFNDIEHFALKILLKEENGKIQVSEVAKRYQEKYLEIAIDEYQDSNLVQEYILSSVSKGNNIFMVGDVKQSIYKFRQAMPELFLNKYHKYKSKKDKQKEDDLKIQLFKNFRSRDNVLDFTNIVFQDIMSNDLGDIEYDEKEYLNLGADYPELKQNFATEIDIIDLKEEEKQENIENEEIFEEKNEEEEERVENIELEARFVANRIKELIKEKFQVWDRKKNQYRNIEYKDIVILLRSTANIAPIYEQEILSLNMPAFSDSSQEYLGSIEIQTIMSLLKIIDNPMQDIPLVTVLRSFIGKFTDDELVQIRLSDKYDNFYVCMQKAMIDVNKELKEKICNFLSNLDKWRDEQEYFSLDELIWKIYIDTGFYNYVRINANGELRQANLKMLFQKAKQYESSNFKGLYNFINFIDRLKLSSGDLGSAKLIGENDNVIRIMSIHKSKGLEFPVVFLSSTGKQFNLMDLNDSVLLHQEMGIGVKYIDYDKQIQYDTLSKASLRSKMLIETLSEEMRILYVALTRAKEKLIITGIKNDYQKDFLKMSEQVERYIKKDGKINTILIKKYKKYLDWILLVYEYEKEKNKNCMLLNLYKKKDILNRCKKIQKEKVNVIEELNKKEITKEEFKTLEKILNYTYPNKLATTIPTKTSVTKLKQVEQEKLDIGIEELIGKQRNLEDKIEDVIEFPKPQFLKLEEKNKLTGAQKGTLIHLCMQNLDEKVDYNLIKVKELINSLVEKQIITKIEADNINPFKILEFTKSEIWRELKTAKLIEREKPFYLNIPANTIYNEEIEETILVQGVIDLYYVNKNNELILVDYKTDYIEKNKKYELVNKYKKQLELYQEALEQSFNKKVSKKYIYSTCLGQAIEI